MKDGSFEKHGQGSHHGRGSRSGGAAAPGSQSTTAGVAMSPAAQVRLRIDHAGALIDLARENLLPRLERSIESRAFRDALTASGALKRELSEIDRELREARRMTRDEAEFAEISTTVARADALRDEAIPLLAKAPPPVEYAASPEPVLIAHGTHDANADRDAERNAEEQWRASLDSGSNVIHAQHRFPAKADNARLDAAPSWDENRATLDDRPAAAPVQRRASGYACDDIDLPQRAAAGVAGTGGRLPHFETIQRAFGAHDISNVQAHVGGAAATAATSIGAEAYATGNHVAFASEPSLFVAAHEAAHVVQQRAGVQLLGGVGQVGDRYEEQADRVAERVVAGDIATDVLGEVRGTGSVAVQRTELVGAALVEELKKEQREKKIANESADEKQQRQDLIQEIHDLARDAFDLQDSGVKAGHDILDEDRHSKEDEEADPLIEIAAAAAIGGVAGAVGGFLAEGIEALHGAAHEAVAELLKEGIKTALEVASAEKTAKPGELLLQFKKAQRAKIDLARSKFTHTFWKKTVSELRKTELEELQQIEEKAVSGSQDTRITDTQEDRTVVEWVNYLARSRHGAMGPWDPWARSDGHGQDSRGVWATSTSLPEPTDVEGYKETTAGNVAPRGDIYQYLDGHQRGDDNIEGVLEVFLWHNDDGSFTRFTGHDSEQGLRLDGAGSHVKDQLRTMGTVGDARLNRIIRVLTVNSSGDVYPPAEAYSVLVTADGYIRNGWDTDEARDAVEFAFTISLDHLR